MPVATETQLQTLRDNIAEANIYVGCTKPADFTPITISSIGVPTGGVWVGLTSGPTVFTYKPDVKGSEIEQVYGEVEPHVVKETASLKFKCAEASFLSIQLATQTGTAVTTAAVGAVPGTQTLFVGGKIFHNTQCVVLISDIGSFAYMSTTVKLYEYVVFYKVMSVTGILNTYKRGEPRMITVDFNAYPDATRATGDQMYQHGKLVGPSSP